MSRFEAFKAKDGKYRWRFVDRGRIVGVRPGRIHVAPLSGRKRDSIEEALDGVLAGIARENERRAAKA